MIEVAILSVIRRWHLREGVPIREIARRTRLSRNTIRRYLASGVVEPVYPQRKSPSKLDPFADMLTCWLEREASRSRKQRRNWRQLYQDRRPDCPPLGDVRSFARGVCEDSWMSSGSMGIPLDLNCLLSDVNTDQAADDEVGHLTPCAKH